MEVNWESSTYISVDMARIKHLLWADNKVTLEVRITDSSINLSLIVTTVYSC